MKRKLVEIEIMNLAGHNVVIAQVVGHGPPLRFRTEENDTEYPTPNSVERFKLSAPKLWEIICGSDDRDEKLYFTFEGRRVEIDPSGIESEEDDVISIPVREPTPHYAVRATSGAPL